MDAVDDADRCGCEPRIQRDEKEYPPMARQADVLVRNAAALVLGIQGKRAGWSPEGVVEEPLWKIEEAKKSSE